MIYTLKLSSTWKGKGLTEMEISKHDKYIVTVEIHGQAFEIEVYLTPDLSNKEFIDQVHMQSRKWLLSQSRVVGHERIDNK